MNLNRVQMRLMSMTFEDAAILIRYYSSGLWDETEHQRLIIEAWEMFINSEMGYMVDE